MIESSDESLKSSNSALKLSDFDFDLPKDLIAQHPSKNREDSKLLVCQIGKKCEKRNFADILDYLKPGDVIVFNDSKVINAQLTLFKDTSGVKSSHRAGDLDAHHHQCCSSQDCKNNRNKRKITVNLCKHLDDFTWEALARPSKYLTAGDVFVFGNHKLTLLAKDNYLLFRFELDNISVFDFLDQYGQVPLPPYIKRLEDNKEDKERYQTVFAKNPGSVAAPTASLHFSERLIQDIKNLGVQVCFITLHVGLGTYMPVKVENIDEHMMHSEYASISKESADIINKAKTESRRVIAVGTTAMRTLESFAEKADNHNNTNRADGDFISSGCKNTDIFIKPGYRFSIPDILITNFHLPKSTLFMLVCAFAGMDEMHQAYRYAINEKMRFFSYGDAMMLERIN